MIEYRNIEALYMILKEQSFELAAKNLFITQSAVSQRIRALEDHYGEPVLIRTLPYRPTKLGRQLIAHYRKVSKLEEELKRDLGAASIPRSIAIAMNRDSLETWFFEMLEDRAFQDISFEIIAEDQELTIHHLKNGSVSACLSTAEKPILGCQASYVGDMEYILAASPSFVEQYFKDKNPKKCLLNAPALKFDMQDNLHQRYLEKYFGLQGADVKYSIIPSVKGFKKMALLGYGCGLIPRIDIIDELKDKRLVQLYPEKTWKIALYWHYWTVESKFFRQFNTAMKNAIKKKLSFSCF